MTTEEFNKKYENHLEEGFYGLAIGNESVIKYLDQEFEKYIKQNPEFQYSQIKMKFQYVRIYTNASCEQNKIWEKEIDKIILNTTEE